MKIKSIKNKLIAVLIVLLCAMLIFSAALIISENKSAEAYIKPPTTADIDEL